MPQNEQNQANNEEISKMFAKAKEGLSTNDTLNEQSKRSFYPTPSYFKSIRMQVDHLMIQSKNVSSTREISLAYTNMQRGFMWLGKVLQQMNEDNPYPESTNVSSPKIEERTDQAKDSAETLEGFNFESGDRTAAIKWFRLKLDGILHQSSKPFIRESQLASEAFEEAKMWFGQELNNIRLASIGQTS